MFELMLNVFQLIFNVFFMQPGDASVNNVDLNFNQVVTNCNNVIDFNKDFLYHVRNWIVEVVTTAVVVERNRYYVSVQEFIHANFSNVNTIPNDTIIDSHMSKIS